MDTTELSTSRSRGADSLSVKAYHSLREQILSGGIRSGRFYLERELEALLGFSRTPIREALVRLENEGLIRIQPRHGMQVQTVSAEDMHEIYQVITALECEAVETLARSGLSSEALSRLQNACERMELALGQDDMHAWADADEEFHQALLTLCGNKRLKQTVMTYWDQTHRSRYLTLRLRDKPVNSTRDHRDVLDAIQRGDAVEAVGIHRCHRREGAKALLNILRDLEKL